jgi:hypothetical protein
LPSIRDAAATGKQDPAFFVGESESTLIRKYKPILCYIYQIPHFLTEILLSSGQLNLTSLHNSFIVIRASAPLPLIAIMAYPE